MFIPQIDELHGANHGVSQRHRLDSHRIPIDDEQS